MRIAMRRGDIKWVRFVVNAPNGYPANIDFTNIYFTVKKTDRDRNVLFQKTLKRAEIYKLRKGDYQFKIEQFDTRSMSIGDYKFDIQVIYKNIIKETFVGDFALKAEVTFEKDETDDEEVARFFLREAPDESTSYEAPDYLVLKLETPEPVIEEAGDYRNLKNKPTINDIILDGDLSLEDLGIQPAGDYPSIPLTSNDIDTIIDSVDE